MSLFSVTVPVTTAQDGSATAYSAPFVGFIHTVAIDTGDFATASGAAVDILLTNESTGEAILTLADMVGDVSLHPRTALQDDMGADIANQYTGFFVNGRVMVEVAQGGGAKTGAISIFVDGEGDASVNAFAARVLTNPSPHTYVDVSKPPYLSDGGGRATSNSLSAWPAQEAIFRARNARVVVGVGPKDTGAGDTLPFVSAHILDAGGQVNPVNQAVTVSVKQVGPTLSGTKVKTSDEGVAIFDDLALDQSGIYNLVFTTSGLTAVESSSFVSAPVALSIGSVSDGSIALAFTVDVDLVDGNGDTYTSDATSIATIALTDAGAATLSGTLTKVATAGVVSFDDLALDTVGTYTLTVTCATASAISEEFDIAFS